MTQSDLGPDDKSVVDRHGSVIVEAQLKKVGDVNEGCDWALDHAHEARSDLFVWDGDGMGLSLRRQVKDALDGKKIDYAMFRGSSGVENPDDIYQEPGKSDIRDEDRKTNKQLFKNLRAQRYWMLRDRVYSTYLAVEKGHYLDPDTLISFSSKIQDLQKLRSELCRIPRKPNPNGMIQIMTKDEMKRLLKIDSPNLADAVMMSLSAPQIMKNEAEVNSFINKNRRLRRMLG